MPFTGTTMRLFPSLTGIQQKVLDIETNLNSKPAVFGIHPNEFIDESSEPRTIKRRSSNPLAYLLNDLIRARLKVRNLGSQALPLYEKLIRFYNDKGYEMTTLREYAEKAGI